MAHVPLVIGSRKWLESWESSLTFYAVEMEKTPPFVERVLHGAELTWWKTKIRYSGVTVEICSHHCTVPDVNLGPKENYVTIQFPDGIVAPFVGRLLFASGGRTIGEPFGCVSIYCCPTHLAGQWPSLLQSRGLCLAERNWGSSSNPVLDGALHGYRATDGKGRISVYEGIAIDADSGNTVRFVAIDYSWRLWPWAWRANRKLFRIVDELLTANGIEKRELTLPRKNGETKIRVRE